MGRALLNPFVSEDEPGHIEVLRFESEDEIYKNDSV